VTLRWQDPIKGFFRVTIDGTDSLMTADGQLIDGDGDGMPGGDYVRFFAQSARLKFTDVDGDRVELKLEGAGTLAAILSAERTPELLAIHDAVAGKSVLEGTVRKPRRRGSDGIATFRSLTVDAGSKFVSTLANPPFRIGPLSQAVIDALLIASDGTLADVLIPA
jgi:hypothetical protein